jgi:hypothetical protein
MQQRCALVGLCKCVYVCVCECVCVCLVLPCCPGVVAQLCRVISILRLGLPQQARTFVFSVQDTNWGSGAGMMSWLKRQTFVLCAARMLHTYLNYSSLVWLHNSLQRYT